MCVSIDRAYLSKPNKNTIIISPSSTPLSFLWIWDPPSLPPYLLLVSFLSPWFRGLFVLLKLAKIHEMAKRWSTAITLDEIHLDKCIMDS